MNAREGSRRAPDLVPGKKTLAFASVKATNFLIEVHRIL